MPKWSPEMSKPDWSGDNDAMRDWVFHQLENYYREHSEELLLEPIDPESGDVTVVELLDSSDASRRKQGLAILRRLLSGLLGADTDRIEWKRKRGRPKGQPRHNLPPNLPKGKKVPAIHYFYNYFARVRMARSAVPIIQNIWRKHYDGKWQRPKGAIDAYEIAADYFLVDVEAVRQPPSGPHRKRPAKDK